MQMRWCKEMGMLGQGGSGLMNWPPQELAGFTVAFIRNACKYCQMLFLPLLKSTACYKNVYNLLFFFLALRIKPRVLWMPRKCSSPTQLYPQAFFLLFLFETGSPWVTQAGFDSSFCLLSSYGYTGLCYQLTRLLFWI